ncbi:DUF5659 domain-containing protein [Candidatus Omnitrophota bacterium]
MDKGKGKIGFRSSDLYLCAFLRSKNVKLIDHEREERKVYFIFEPAPEIEGLIQSYWNNGAVEVSSYVKSLDDLKSIIFSTNRDRKGDRDERCNIPY